MATINAKKQCAVCAWRENCTKKHTIKDSAINCPDFTRDENLPPEEDGEEFVEKKSHKKIEDVFGD